MPKNERNTAKARKTIGFHRQICKCAMFLLPSSSCGCLSSLFTCCDPGHCPKMHVIRCKLSFDWKNLKSKVDICYTSSEVWSSPHACAQPYKRMRSVLLILSVNHQFPIVGFSLSRKVKGRLVMHNYIPRQIYVVGSIPSSVLFFSTETCLERKGHSQGILEGWRGFAQACLLLARHTYWIQSLKQFTPRWSYGKIQSLKLVLKLLDAVSCNVEIKYLTTNEDFVSVFWRISNRGCSYKSKFWLLPQCRAIQ